MPSLRDLANNLATFDYYSGPGNFTQNKIGYGSEKPLITTPPGFRWSPSNFDDGFLQFGAATIATRSAADVLRIGKFLTSTISGPLFMVKQIGLQKSNVRLEHNGESTDSNKEKFGSTRVWSPLPLLAQVAGSGIGARFMRHGEFPGVSNTSDYSNYVIVKDREGGNRLVTLSRALSSDYSGGDMRKSQRNYVLKYKGGPGSLYGLGDTTIGRYGNTLNAGNRVVDFLDDYNSKDVAGSRFVAIPTKNLITPVVEDSQSSMAVKFYYNSDVPGQGYYEFGEKSDFRGYKNKLKTLVPGNVLPVTNYKKLNLENRLGIAKNRKSLYERVDYTSNVSNTHDRVNALSLYYSDKPNPDFGTVKDFNGNDVGYNPDDNGNNVTAIRDMIKFRIKSIDNDNPTKGVYMVFRSYINTIKRSFTSKWKDYSYMGRGENFYLYDGFAESFHINFTIAASSRFEMKSIYQKLNYLISTLTPDYNSLGRMRGNLSELTVGNFLLYQPGVITSLDMIIDEDSNWDIAIDEYEDGNDKDMHELPQLIKCSMTFIPIYNFLPRKSAQSPFIGIDYFPKIKEGQKWLSKGTMPNAEKKELKESVPAPEPIKKKPKWSLSVPEPEKSDNFGKTATSDFSYTREPE
jgi:hypothetical protein